MAEPKTIRLNGTEFKIRPLKLGQLEVLLPLFSKVGDLTTGNAVGPAIEILAAALKSDHPEMTPEKLRETETGGIGELLTAIGVISEMTGLTALGEARAGRR